MRGRLKRLALSARNPAVQLTLKLALAILITLLYAGHQGAKHGPQIADLTSLPTEKAGPEAAFAALLGAGLLINALFPRPRLGQYSQQINLVNGLLGFLTLFIAATVGWNWLQDATSNKSLDYIRPVLVYTGVISAIVLFCITIFVVIIRVRR